MIRIRNLRKAYVTENGPVEAVGGIDLEISEGQFCVLLGPSGCGKTTTLRCVAGLERPDSGQIAIGKTLVTDTDRGIFFPSEKRDFGMVFQSYAIWPHMTVFQNVAFPLTDGWRRVKKSEMAERVERALRLVQLEGLEQRSATQLSGGQQQRVALARAIVTEPCVLLMDEPLSNLDARLREEMRTEIRKLTQEVGVTTLYVTHDQSEALTLGDRVCVMNRGEILQVGSPEEIYQRPVNLFVAQFVGQMNFVGGQVVDKHSVASALGTISCSVPSDLQVGQNVTLAIRPEHVKFLRDGDSFPDGGNSVKGNLTGRWFLGPVAVWEVRVGEAVLVAHLPADLHLSIGNSVRLLLPAERWRVFSEH